MAMVAIVAYGACNNARKLPNSCQTPSRRSIFRYALETQSMSTLGHTNNKTLLREFIIMAKGYAL
jgi:hypothetical protein